MSTALPGVSPPTAPGGAPFSLMVLPARQELRTWEEELTRAALQQKNQEELLRRREQELAEREIDILERELNIIIHQLCQEKPRVKKRKGKFRKSRLKLKDGNRISLPSGWYPGDLGEGFPGEASGKEPACQCRRRKTSGFNPWVRKIPWRRAWQPTPVFSPGESPETEEPGGLQSMGPQRVGYN